MPVRENTPEGAGLRSAHPVSRLRHGTGRREGARLFARSPVVQRRNGLAAGGRGIRTCMGPFLSSGVFSVYCQFLVRSGKWPFFIPSPTIRFPERAQRVKGPKR